MLSGHIVMVTYLPILIKLFTSISLIVDSPSTNTIEEVSTEMLSEDRNIGNSLRKFRKDRVHLECIETGTYWYLITYIDMTPNPKQKFCICSNRLDT